MSDADTIDLGHLDGPVLCFGGPYSNAQATGAMLAEAKKRGIPPERIICTGDVVAYGGDAQSSVDLIRLAGIHVVMGNCEESLGFNSDDCNCGFEDGSDCAQWSADWFTHAAATLDQGALAWMRRLPRQLRFTLGGRRFAVIHGGDENISEYIFASTNDAAKIEILGRLDVDAVIGGHSGLPFTQVINPRGLDTQNTNGQLWHNPGAISMPANDATPRGWYGILTSDEGGISITLHGLDYDYDRAAKAIRAVNPDLPYAQTLEDGLWPNMAVLPGAERKRCGIALKPAPVHWPNRLIAAAE